MKSTNAKLFLSALTLCAGVITALAQPSITFLALRGEPQTPFDQQPYGRHFYITLPLTALSANALGQTVHISPGALVYLDTPTVSGTGPFSYQWQADGVDLPGQNNATLGFPGTDLAAAFTRSLLRTQTACPR